MLRLIARTVNLRLVNVDVAGQQVAFEDFDSDKHRTPLERDIWQLQSQLAQVHQIVRVLDERVRSLNETVPQAFQEEFRLTRKAIWEWPIFSWTLFASLIANAFFLWIR